MGFNKNATKISQKKDLLKQNKPEKTRTLPTKSKPRFQKRLSKKIVFQIESIANQSTTPIFES
jgi:hypothetical protein